MDNIKETLENKAQYLCVSIPYDKDDEPHLISFDDGCITEGKAPKPVKTYKWHRVEELVSDIMSKHLSEEEKERLREELRRM